MTDSPDVGECAHAAFDPQTSPNRGCHSVAPYECARILRGWCSLSTMTWSRHSSRSVRMLVPPPRWAQGAPMGIRALLTPARSSCAGTTLP